MKRIGLSMTPEQLTNLLRTHQLYPNYIAKDAVLVDWDKDHVTNELLFVFHSPTGTTKDREAIAFPAVAFRGDGQHPD